MSLLLARLGTPAADGKLYADFTEEFQLSFEDDFEFSFAYGPLSDDVVVVLDQIVNTFEDGEVADEADYSFSFTLTEDAQLYAAQFESEEALDEQAEDFTASPLADDFVDPDDKVYSATLDDELEVDAGEDFAFALLEDAQVYSLAQDDSEAAEELGEETSLTLLDDAQVYGLLSFDDGAEPDEETDGLFLGPLSDDFVVAAEDQFQFFDEYEENDENEYSFYLGNLSEDAAPVVDVVPPGGGGAKRKKRRVIAYYKRHLIDKHGNFIKVPTEEEFEATVAALPDEVEVEVVAVPRMGAEMLKTIEDTFTKALKKRQQSKKDFDYKTVRAALEKAREVARQMDSDDELMFVIALA